MKDSDLLRSALRRDSPLANMLVMLRKPVFRIDDCITSSDLWDLIDPVHWLKNHMIDSFLSLVVDSRTNKDMKVHVAYLNATYKTSIDKFDIVLVPICKSSHWTLAVVDVRGRTVHHYNSMKFTPSANKDILDFLSRWKKEHDTPFQLRTIKMDKQKNAYDCGVYVCVFAELFLLGHKLSSLSDSDMMYHRCRIAHSLLHGKLSPIGTRL